MLNTTRIRDRMAELNVTQKDIADALGLASPTVSQKLSRVRPMSLDEAEKIAELLKIENAQFGYYFFT